MSKRLREWRLSRARAARAEKPAAPDPPATAPDPATAPPAADPELSEKFAKKAHDLDAVRKSVEDAASVSAGLWLSYLFVLLYIGIAAGAVTHRDLLLESPVKLPFLSVDLPLVAFFFLAPILFIVSHAYTLMHFVMLAAKVGVFDAELRAQLGDAPETRKGLRRQLPSNIFVQFLAGPRDIRDGGLGWLLKAIAWITLVIGPVLLLLLIQVQFLPYHLEWVTWVQRFAVLVDLMLLWTLWPAVVDSRSEIKWPPLWRHKITSLVSLVAIGLAFTAATFPGEGLDKWIGKRRWIPPYPSAKWSDQKDWSSFLTTWYGQEGWTSFHDLLFNGDVDAVTRRRKSLFSNTLVLPAFDALEAAKIDDPKKLDSVTHTLVLRGRHLESAVFESADLRKADLAYAHLHDASLRDAQLQRASLDYAQLQDASLDQAQLQGASLDQAQLQGASLDHAQLQGASLREPQLEGASLRQAQLQGASLVDANLRGASLEHAHLQGASLVGANLRGASLVGANLRGASLHAQLEGASLQDAQLQGASLDHAQLQGALLDYARLQGASLDDVRFEGASLFKAQLQGASLEGAQLQGARFLKAALDGTNMRNAVVWRTSFEDASLTAIFEDGVTEIAFTKGEFAFFNAFIMKEVPESGQENVVGPGRKQALKRIEKLNPDIFGPEASEQETLDKGRVDETGYRSALADQLKSIACSKAENALHNAPHIVRGLVANGRIMETGAQAPVLVEAILKPDCPVSAALTEADKVALEEIAKDAKAALEEIAKEAGGAH
jgi:uncharacterized protein YjbI with pentapeptide repeats